MSQKYIYRARIILNAKWGIKGANEKSKIVSKGNEAKDKTNIQDIVLVLTA
jgi:hypothetical protein